MLSDLISHESRSLAAVTNNFVYLKFVSCHVTWLEELRDNLTISVMSFVPTLDDDGKPITCRAENPNVTSLFMETTWTINVVYPPVVKLRLGSSLAAGDIKEGDDVYFECHVRANPPARKLSWLHDGQSVAGCYRDRDTHHRRRLLATLFFLCIVFEYHFVPLQLYATFT
ncbi:hypothetical protein KGM_211045 [Danaus plexippus plexippus]|uniref:Ig-like domain-containing protein n=1 Tax=Danaus plexippus plexippus TaxID=278856 RepID=A0A212EX62_DANPL|nr:hypothetical protein KGM_211045 [Danaus plexippus plexippus]